MIEALSKKHFDDVYLLAVEFCKNSPYSSMSVDYSTLMNTLEVCSKTGLSFVYTDNERAVGVLLGLSSPAWFNSSIVNAMELMWWIEKEYRGCGWLLKDAYEQAAIAQGIKHIGLATLSTSYITEKLLKDGYVSRETAWIKEI